MIAILYVLCFFYIRIYEKVCFIIRLLVLLFLYFGVVIKYENYFNKSKEKKNNFLEFEGVIE